MGFMQFITDHTLGVGIGVIFLGLIWEFGIKPRIGLTNREIEKKITDTMDKVQDNLTTNFEINQEDIIDNSSIPFSNQK